jgi:predicted PurR-regulated permease PerM
MQKAFPQYIIHFSERHFMQARRILLAILFVAAIIAVVVLLRDLITPVVISVFLAYLLAPLVDAIENRGLSRTAAVIIVFLSFMVTFGLMISLLWRNMLDELQHLIAGVKIDNPEQLIDGIKQNLKAALPGLAHTNIIDKLVEIGVQYGEKFIDQVMQGVAGLFSAIGEIIIIPFLIFFILKDSRSLKKNIVKRIPNRYFEMSLSLIHKASLQLGLFIRGQLLDATIVGILAMIALSFLKLRYALLIGVLAGMANMIPFLGPIVGGIPAIIVSIVDKGDFSGVPAIIVAFAVIKLIDDVIVQPMVVSKSVELHPVVVIISIFAGGHLGGILGMIVAVPLVSIAKVTISILYWGFTKYHIFSPPPYALAEPEVTAPMLLPSGVVAPQGGASLHLTPPPTEMKKPSAVVNSTDEAHSSTIPTGASKRVRQSKKS